MSALAEVLSEVREKGIKLIPNGDGLDIIGVDSVLTPDLIQDLKTHKTDIIQLINDRLHGCSINEVKQLAGDDWSECKNKPKVLEAFAHLVAIRKLRESGEKPADYTQKSTCNLCGPSWLWEGAPSQVQACVWCFNRPKGVHIPRPETIACNTCQHFTPNDHSPGAGVGGCNLGNPGHFAKEKHNLATYHINQEG